MSIQATIDAWKVTGLSVVQKITLVKLADMAGNDGRCWPSISTVAAECACDERSIFRALDALEKLGHITRTKRPGTSSVYAIHPCHTVTPDTESPLTQSHPTPDTESPYPCHTVTLPLTGCQANLQGTVKNRKRTIPPTPETFLPGIEPPPEDPTSPLPFASPEFAIALDDFRQHRKEIRKPLKPTGEKQLLRSLERMGEHDAIEAMRRSITNGWQGVFPERPTNGKHAPKGQIPRNYGEDDHDKAF